MILVRMINDINKGLCSFVFLDEVYTVTGGGINMAQSMTIKQIKAQIDILDAMDTQAKDAGAVCASPVYTDFEVKQLKAMGQYAISPNPIEPSEERSALLAKMQITLKQSICM